MIYSRINNIIKNIRHFCNVGYYNSLTVNELLAYRYE